MQAFPGTTVLIQMLGERGFTIVNGTEDLICGRTLLSFVKQIVSSHKKYKKREEKRGEEKREEEKRGEEKEENRGEKKIGESKREERRE